MPTMRVDIAMRLSLSGEAFIFAHNKVNLCLASDDCAIHLHTYTRFMPMLKFGEPENVFVQASG